MALGKNVSNIFYSPRGELVRSVPVTSRWQTIIDAPGMTIQDGATITTPLVQITDSTRHPLVVDGLASNLLLRLVYDATSTTITNAVVKVFGRTRTDVYSVVRTTTAAISSTMTTSIGSDISDGTYLYTNPTTVQTFPILGYMEILVGVEVALASVTGDPALASLQARVY